MKSLKRFLLKHLYPIAPHIWKLTKPTTIGVRVIIIDNDEVLLVRHSYRSGFYFPGGAIDKFELIIDAARREINEEVNVAVGKLSLSGVYRRFEENKDDTLFILATEEVVNRDSVEIDNTEIIEYKWSKLNKMPKDIDPKNKEYLESYLNEKSKVSFD